MVATTDNRSATYTPVLDVRQNVGRFREVTMKRIGESILLMILLSYTLYASEWSGIRDGVVHIRTSTSITNVTVTWRNVWAADGHDECLYLQTQNGRLLKRVAIPAAKINGTAVLSLSAPGDYLLSIPGYSFRAYSVSAPTGCSLLFEPTIHHPSIQTNGALRWYFKLDRAGSFVLHAKDHRGAHSVNLTGPDGIQRTLILRDAKSIPYREHDSLIVRDAAAGEWQIGVDNAAKLAIWLDGCANIFAAPGDPWWIPRADTGSADISVSPVQCGITTRLAALLPERELPNFAYDSLRALGIEAATYYLQQSHHGSLLLQKFKSWHHAYRAHLGIGASHGILQTLPPIKGGFDSSALPMMRALAQRDTTETFFIALADEPNTLMNDPASFIPIVKAAASAAGKRPILAIAESAGFLNGPMAGDAVKRRGYDWDKAILAKCDTAIGALTWHEWNIHDLPATEFYHRSIDSAWALSHRYPGGASRKLMITQTNIACGGDFSPAQQDGFYAALWYASVIAQCNQTGKLSFLGWFPAVDDDHHRKGFMTWNGVALRIKPVGRAAALAASVLLPNALTCTSSAFEVDVASSCSADQQTLALLLVNKGKRVEKTVVSIDLPKPLRQHSLKVDIIRLEASGSSRPDYPLLAPALSPKIRINLPPESITGITLRQSGL